MMKLTTLVMMMVCANLASAKSSPSIEVVQSVPVETNLEVPGIRHTQAVWLEMINSAKTSIDLEQFYISDKAGEQLEPVLKAIEQAAVVRGVRVRLIADKKFYANYPESVNAIGKLPKAEMRILDYSVFGGVQHAKFFMVDGKQSFLGSANFDWRALNQIHEIGLKITDKKVNSDLARVFEKDWNMALTGQVVSEDPAAPPVRLFDKIFRRSSDLYVVASPLAANPSAIPESLKAITDLIDSAVPTKRLPMPVIRIQVMEYNTRSSTPNAPAWKGLDDSIRKAAERGIRVQLLVDFTNIKKAEKSLKDLAAVKNIEVKTVLIPQWSGGAIDYARLVHSKYMVVDTSSSTSVSWVGTENWSQGYFFNTRNVGVMIKTQSVSDQLKQVFDRVWNSAYSTAVK